MIYTPSVLQSHLLVRRRNSKLNWSDHITKVVNKANRTRAFLQRNLKQCPCSIKIMCYESYVRPILEYSCTVWAPFTHCDIYKLELVQRRAARFVNNNFSRFSSVSQMLINLNWPTLEERRTKAKLIMLYKIFNNLVDIPHPLSFDNSPYNTRGTHNLMLNQMSARINVY